MTVCSGMPLRVGSSEWLSIAVAGGQWHPILKWIKAILRTSNQELNSVQWNSFDELGEGNGMVGVASEHFSDNLSITIKQLHADPVADDV